MTKQSYYITEKEFFGIPVPDSSDEEVTVEKKEDEEEENTFIKNKKRPRAKQTEPKPPPKPRQKKAKKEDENTGKKSRRVTASEIIFKSTLTDTYIDPNIISIAPSKVTDNFISPTLDHKRPI
jgi:hypothetical protein